MERFYHTEALAWMTGIRRAPALLEQLLAAIGEDDERFVGELRRLAAEVEDWFELFTSAAKHGVAYVLFGALQKAGVRIPEEVRKRADKLAAIQSLENELSLRALRRSLEVLDESGLEVAVLKGPLLAERLYRSPLARPSLDIDLLIDDRDLEAARIALGRVGYQEGNARQARHDREHHHHVLLFHDAYPVLELHFLTYEGFGVKIPSAPFLARSVEWAHHGPTGGPRSRGPTFRARVLCPEDELVYLTVHGAGHRFERLSWLYDLKLLVDTHPTLEADKVLATADTFGVRRPVVAGLVHLRRTLGAGLAAFDEAAAARDLGLRLALPLFGADVAPNRARTVTPLLNLGASSLLCDSPALALRNVVKKVTVDLPRRWAARRDPIERRRVPEDQTSPLKPSAASAVCTEGRSSTRA